MSTLIQTRNFRQAANNLLIIGGVIGGIVILARGVNAIDQYHHKTYLMEALATGKKTFTNHNIGDKRKVFAIQCDDGSANAFELTMGDNGVIVASKKPYLRSSVPVAAALCPQ